jgi:hypothetical protein
MIIPTKMTMKTMSMGRFRSGRFADLAEVEVGMLAAVVTRLL